MSEKNENRISHGASGDIGEAVCRRLAADGWSLYCHYYQHEEKVLNFVSDLQEAYPHQDFLWYP